MLQALLLSKHLLVVGTSMADDNVLRLIHEVAAFRALHEAADTNGHSSAPSSTCPTTRPADCCSDASWLLDERFGYLLTDEQRQMGRRSPLDGSGH